MTNVTEHTVTLHTIGTASIPPRRKVLGLTGNPGAGKSLVAQWFADAGAIVVDADREGHALLTAESPVRNELIDTFGPDIEAADGSIDRKKLGAIVFADEHQLQRLNQIVHPRIHQSLRGKIESFRRSETEGPILIDAALIYEWDAQQWMDGVLVVAAPLDVRRERFAHRGASAETFDRREAAQLPQSFKIEQADVVFENNASIDHLYKQFQSFWTQ